MKYFPSNFVVESLRALFKRRVGDAIPAYLGDTHGAGARVDVPGKPGYVFVHFPNGKDANGFALYSPPTIARSGGAAYLNYPGSGVYVGYGYDGELEIKAAQNRFLDQAGINTSTLNPLNQQSKWVYPWQLTYGLALAVANSVTDSTLVMVKKLRAYVGNTWIPFDTPLEADKPDLAAVIPIADEQAYATLWLDTYTGLTEAISSVAQSLDTPMEEEDLQETIFNASESRPPDAIPLKAFYLANNQTTITQNALDVDMRQLLDNPVLWGFPTDLKTRERVWPGYTLVTGSYTEVDAGSLTVETGGKVIIVHQNNFTAILPPTITDDSNDGYTVGSVWYDTVTHRLFIAQSVSIGAAVWGEVTLQNRTIASSADSGTEGEMAVDNDYLCRYIGTQWVRIAWDATPW